MNVLLTCAGRRNYLVHYFRDALAGSGLVFATDASLDAPAMQEADHAVIVPRVNDSGYIAFLLDVCKANRIGMLVSLNDLELPVLAAAKQRFAAMGVIAAVSSAEVVDIAFDKWRTRQFLTSCGLATCATYLTLEDSLHALNDGRIAFPLIVKPRWGTASISIECVHDIEELETAYRLTQKRLTRSFLAEQSATDQERCVLIQECLTGDEYGLDVVNDLHGNAVAVFVKKKLTMRAGETDRAVTVDQPDLRELGGVLGTNLGHVGNLDCDVFLTAEGPRVLEINPRFGGGYPFSHEAGANVPAALIAWAEGRDPDPAWFQVESGITFSKCDRLVRKVLTY